MTEQKQQHAYHGAMHPFSTLEAALEFIKLAPLTGDQFEIAMAEGFTVDGKPDRPIGKLTMGTVGLTMALLARDFKREAREQHEGFTLYRFSRIQMSSSEQPPFPPDFKLQRVRLPNAITLSTLPPSEIADYFEQHPEAVADLIGESEDKRYSPSTFVTRKPSDFRVGWFSTTEGEQCVKTLQTVRCRDRLLVILAGKRQMARTRERWGREGSHVTGRRRREPRIARITRMNQNASVCIRANRVFDSELRASRSQRAGDA